MNTSITGSLYPVVIFAVLAVQIVAFSAVVFALRLAQQGKADSPAFEACSKLVKVCRALTASIIILIVLVEPEVGFAAAAAYALWKALANPIQSRYVDSQLDLIPRNASTNQ